MKKSKKTYLLILIVLQCVVSFCHQKSNQLTLLESVLTNSPIYLFTQPHISGPERIRIKNEILNRINQSRVEIVFWFYGLNEPEIIDALVNAKKRGVKLVLTGSSDQDYFQLKKTELTYRLRAKSGLQHTKLMIIDRSIIISGTGNFTKSGLYYNNNLFFFSTISFDTATRIIESLEDESKPSIIEWSDKTAKFRMMVSPANGRTIQSELVQSVRSANHIRFLIYSFTDIVLATAFAQQAKQGSIVEGVIELGSRDSISQTQSIRIPYFESGQSHFYLYADGNDLSFNDENEIQHGGKMHHKTLIVDNRILTGSFNWSISARDSNLEVFFEIIDPYAIQEFQNEFNRIRANSTLIARSPWPILKIENNLCNQNQQESIVYQGRGAFFRGLFYKNYDCSSPVSNSAGFQISSLYNPDNSDHTNSLTYQLFNCSSINCDICQIGKCKPFKFDRISFDYGFLWLPNWVAPIRRLVLLSRQGLTQVPIIEQTDSYLKFENQGLTNAILFLETDDQILIGCAANSPPTQITSFINSLLWFYPNSFNGTIRCGAVE
ncbi:MAG: hypothetical protein H3C43_00090 [Leptonema sp. (in: Bacteria)]|nr:hypothetical protein [Leptonema sp. (in: bacteria)]